MNHAILLCFSQAYMTRATRPVTALTCPIQTVIPGQMAAVLYVNAYLVSLTMGLDSVTTLVVRQHVKLFYLIQILIC